MTRRLLVRLAAGAILAGLAAALAVALLHRPPQAGVRLAGKPVAVQRTLSPAEPQFGDSVVATVDVFVDPQRVDPDSVRLDTSFAPFAVVSSERSVRTVAGVEVVHLVHRLDCLAAACLPKDGTASVRLPNLHVTYAGGGSVVVAWPALRVHARVQAADLEHPTLRVAPPQTHTSYRLPPGPTGWALIALAVAAGIAGLVLLARAAFPAFARARAGSSPVDRILDELAASENGSRRGLLERLARELEPLDERLSYESRVLAWAPQDPEPEAISDLTRRVRTAVPR